MVAKQRIIKMLFKYEFKGANVLLKWAVKKYLILNLLLQNQKVALSNKIVRQWNQMVKQTSYTQEARSLLKIGNHSIQYQVNSVYDQISSSNYFLGASSFYPSIFFRMQNNKIHMDRFLLIPDTNVFTLFDSHGVLGINCFKCIRFVEINFLCIVKFITINHKQNFANSLEIYNFPSQTYSQKEIIHIQFYNRIDILKLIHAMRENKYFFSRKYKAVSTFITQRL